MPLNSLRVEKGTVHVQSEAMKILWAIPGVIVFVMVILYSESILKLSTNFYYALLALSVIIGGAGVILTKKRKAYVYHYKSGEVAFDVSELGNTSEEFEEFCEEVEKRITS